MTYVSYHVFTLITIYFLIVCGFLFSGMSEQLLGYFTKPIAVKHPGGHYVPSSESVRKAFVQFLEEGIYEENLDEESGLSDFSESVSDNESD